MWAAGETPGCHPAPDVAVFADTGAEPEQVYDWLAHLKKWLPFPVVTVSGGDLREETLAAWRGENVVAGTPPLYVRGGAGFEHKPLNVLWRKCTQEYKLKPIRRWLQANRRGRPVVQYLGISRDEIVRMKPSGVGYITNVWPLIDAGLTRHSCLTWMERAGWPRPPRSACTFCPYRTNAQWRDLRDLHPSDWDDAVEFDRAIRTVPEKLDGAKVFGQAFVHRSGVPLEEANIEEGDPNQADLFGNECEGMCGV